MAIRLLLDEHISPQVARRLRERGIDARSLQEWHDGQYLSRPDEEILRAADSEERVLVSFDVQTIPTLIRYLVEAGIDHAGVIFVSAKTIRPADIGTLVDSLERLVIIYQAVGLRNQVLFLPR